MLSFFRDLPDGALGLMVALALHFGLCYVVLAPRAMEAQLESEVTPVCTASLSAEQDRALSEAQQEDAQTRSRARLELGRLETQLNAFQQVSDLYRQSGINDLLGSFGVSTQTVSSEEIAALRRQAEGLRSILNRAPDFSALQASATELLQTCTCAALQAAAGKRTSYAISLATFRLVEPDDVSGVTDATLRAAGGSSCGELPWRNS